jgi:hypothetical protein
MDYTTYKKMIPEIIRMYLGRLSKDKRRQEKEEKITIITLRGFSRNITIELQ